MIILGIETSCDETAVAVVEASGDLKNPKFEILGSSLISQANLHAEYGGVYPNLAKREHIKNLPHVYKHALEQAKISEDKINIIAVTVGPGLEPALWVGINFAKELGEKLKVPIIPTNHMLGHVASVLLSNKKLEFPAIALLVSGGHTELVLLKDWKNKKIIGETKDDAVGEAFDKVARMLGLPYPGGPQISALAEKARNSNIEIRNIKLPRPMINSGDLNFSFSGLKTAVLYYLRSLENSFSAPASECTDIFLLKNSSCSLRRASQSTQKRAHSTNFPEEIKLAIAREFEDAVIEVLTTKTKKAIKEHDAKSLIIGGGVIANRELRETFKKLSTGLDISLLLPSYNLATDNAVMIAVAAYIQTDCGRSLPPSDILFSSPALGNLKIS